MAESHLLSGEDRIEHWKRIGRSIRKGTLSELESADQNRVLAALNSGDLRTFEDYISILNPQYLGMSSTLLEWCLAFPPALEKNFCIRGSAVDKKGASDLG